MSSTTAALQDVASVDEFLNVAATETVPLFKHLEFESYYWHEVRENFGGGIRLLNDEGNVEFGTATDNPQGVVDGAGGSETVHGGTEYGRWVETRLQFDWTTGSVEVQFRDTATGTSYTGTHEL